MDTIPVIEHSSESREGAALAKAVVAALAGRYKSVSACAFLILPIFALAGCWHSQTAFNLPDPKVLLALPVQQNVEVHSGWVATLYPNAEIRPQGSRYIVSQDYRQGAVVRNDQVLFAIDPHPFQANLECAKGELAQGRSHTFAWFLPHSRRYFDHRGRTGWLGNPRMCGSLKTMIATMLRCFARRYCFSLKREYTLNLSNSRDAVDHFYTDGLVEVFNTTDDIIDVEASPSTA